MLLHIIYMFWMYFQNPMTCHPLVAYLKPPLQSLGNTSTNYNTTAKAMLHSTACFAIWLTTDNCQCYLTTKLSDVKDMSVSSRRFTTCLGPWVKVHSHQRGAEQCKGGVTSLGYQLERRASWRRHFGRTFSLMWWTTKVKWSAAGQLHRDLQQKTDTVMTVESVTLGWKWAHIHRRAWCAQPFRHTTIQTM